MHQNTKADIRECFSIPGFPKNFATFTGTYQCWSLFLINFIKKETPTNFQQQLFL